jgi:hypothetical protein
MLMTGRNDKVTLRFYETAGFERGGKAAFQARRDRTHSPAQVSAALADA